MAGNSFIKPPGYLLEFVQVDKHKEQSTNWDSTDSAPQLPTKHLLARFNPQPVHIVVVGMRRLNIYCCSAQNGQRNASVRTMRVWWKSSSLRDICHPIQAAPDGLVMTTTTTTTTSWPMKVEQNWNEDVRWTCGLTLKENRKMRSWESYLAWNQSVWWWKSDDGFLNMLNVIIDDNWWHVIIDGDQWNYAESTFEEVLLWRRIIHLMYEKFWLVSRQCTDYEQVGEENLWAAG